MDRTGNHWGFLVLALFLLIIGSLFQVVPLHGQEGVNNCELNTTHTKWLPSVDQQGEFLPSPIEGWFTENQGQLGEGAGRYYSAGDPVSVAFGNGWMAYRIKEETQGFGGSLIHVRFEGARDVEPVGVDPLWHKTNFLLGSDPERWISGARNYHGVLYRDLWNGIDLEYSITDRGLKYEFVVHPNADPRQIEMLIKGHDGLSTPESGALVISSKSGDIRDTGLDAFYQDGPSEKVHCAFDVRSGDTFGFQPGEYNETRVLVIDPLVFSTFLGGGSDRVDDMAVDTQGCAYILGNTQNVEFPTTPGAFRSDDVEDRGVDMFITKFDPNGTSLLYSTLLGGSASEFGHAIFVDESGFAYVTGSGQSDDFPVTDGAFQSSHQGFVDTYVSKLSADGSSLIFSTYLGGEDWESARDIFVDESGNVYLTGITGSTDFPTTSGAFMTKFQKGDTDAFIVKLDPDGKSLLGSTFIGGRGYDNSNGIDVDDSGIVFICGGTNSFNFPTTPGAFRTTIGDEDDTGNKAFVLKLAANFSAPIYSTLIDNKTQTQDLILVNDGSVHVTGGTWSEDFPTTPNCFQTALAGSWDAYIFNLNEDGSKLNFCTLIGGELTEVAHSIAMDEEGTLFITGETQSTDFPTTLGCFQDTLRGSEYDAFICMMNNDASILSYSTYIGGSDRERSKAIAIVMDGSVIVAGTTHSEDYPTTPGVFDTGFHEPKHGQVLAFITRLIPEPSFPISVDSPEGSPLYARYRAYDFTVNANFYMRESPMTTAILTLDPSGVNVSLRWDYVDNLHPFSVLSDPYGYVSLESDHTDVEEDEANNTIWLHFNVVFEWTWPHEEACDAALEGIWSNGTLADPIIVGDLFSVENDLELVGNIDATGEWQGPISDGDWVRSGEEVHLTGAKAVYQGTTDKYPPDESCTLRVEDDDGDTETSAIISGVETDISIITDDTTDSDEILTLTLDDLPGNALCETNWTMNIKVDGDMPEFNNPIPDGDDWHSELGMRVAISSMDMNGSGIDASTLEYSYSINGTEGYGDWNRIDLDTEPDGETVDAMVYITFQEGDDNYLRWRVKDMVGNGYTISEDFQIKIDTQHIVFSIPTPKPERWYTSINFESGCTISDRTGSGVDVRSIQFRVSRFYPSQYGDWIDWNEGPLIDNQEVVTATEVEFSESPYNFIQWRAKDVAGNGYSTSAHYRYRIDISPPVFTEISPNPDEKQESGEVTIWVVTDDDLSGVHWFLQYRYGTSGEESMGDWEEMDGRGSVPVFTFNVRFARGILNVLQLKILDNAGNNATSEILSIWVNRRPVAIIATQMNRTVFYENETIEFDGTGSYDDDGDSIIYGWVVDHNDTAILVGINGTITLPPGTHDVSLTIWDGYDDGYGHASVQITVLEVPQEPETHVDEDNWMLVMIIIVIIIIIVILGIVLRRTQLTPL